MRILNRNSKGQIVRRKTGEIYDGFGVWYDPKGYACICVGGKDIKLHRYIWEKANGTIPKGYQLHHIDGNKKNYVLANLMLVSQPDHFKIHAGWVMEDGKWTKKPCNNCNKILPLNSFYQRKGFTPSALCKKCHNVATQKYQNNPIIKAKIKLRKKEQYEQNKLSRPLFRGRRV